MQNTVEFRGSYQYATSTMLESALVAARGRLDDASIDDVDWLRCFSREGTVLYIHAALPEHVNMFFTTSILRELASTAMHGAVEARKGGSTHEYYFVEDTADVNDE